MVSPFLYKSMGCRICRDEVFTPEAFLQERERELAFSHFPVVEIDLFIRKVASQTEVNKRQFQLIIEHFQTGSLISHENRIFSMYLSCLLQNRGVCNRNEMLVLACLYGQGSAEEKYQVLFEICDIDCQKVIFFTDARYLAETIVKIAIVEIALLANLDQVKAEQGNKVKVYIKTLKRAAEGTAAAIAKALFPMKKDRCYLQHGLQALQDPQIARLTRASGVRELASEWVDRQQSKAKVKKVLEKKKTGIA